MKNIDLALIFLLLLFGALIYFKPEALFASVPYSYNSQITTTTYSQYPVAGVTTTTIPKDSQVKLTLLDVCNNRPLSLQPMYVNNNYVSTTPEGVYETKLKEGLHVIKVPSYFYTGLVHFKNDIVFEAEMIDQINVVGETFEKTYEFEYSRGIKIITNVDSVVVPYISPNLLDCRSGCVAHPLDIGYNSFNIIYGDQTKVASANVERCKITDVIVNF